MASMASLIDQANRRGDARRASRAAQSRAAPEQRYESPAPTGASSEMGSGESSSVLSSGGKSPGAKQRKGPVSRLPSVVPHGSIGAGPSASGAASFGATTLGAATSAAAHDATMSETSDHEELPAPWRRQPAKPSRTLPRVPRFQEQTPGAAAQTVTPTGSCSATPSSSKAATPKATRASEPPSPALHELSIAVGAKAAELELALQRTPQTGEADEKRRPPQHEQARTRSVAAAEAKQEAWREQERLEPQGLRGRFQATMPPEDARAAAVEKQREKRAEARAAAAERVRTCAAEREAHAAATAAMQYQLERRVVFDEGLLLLCEHVLRPETLGLVVICRKRCSIVECMSHELTLNGCLLAM